MRRTMGALFLLLMAAGSSMGSQSMNSSKMLSRKKRNKESFRYEYRNKSYALKEGTKSFKSTIRRLLQQKPTLENKKLIQSILNQINDGYETIITKTGAYDELINQKGSVFTTNGQVGEYADGIWSAGNDLRKVFDGMKALYESLSKEVNDDQESVKRIEAQLEELKALARSISRHSQGIY